MTISSLYWIRCADHTDLMSQGYVGVSGEFKRRMYMHSKHNENPHLRNAINKYGWDNLVKEEILIGTDEYCYEIEAKLRPQPNIGWNIAIGGGKPPIVRDNGFKKGSVPWSLGKKIPEETVKKISQTVSKVWENPEYRKHMSSVLKGRSCPMKGKKHRPESIEKMRQTKLGVVSKKKGRLLKDEQKLHLSQLMRQKPWECPHCSKIGYGEGAKNRWHFDRCKVKIVRPVASEEIFVCQ